MQFRNLFSSIAAKVAFGPRQSKLGPEQWTPELLKRLEWRRFEELCAAYFEALGFRVELAANGAEGGTISLYSKGARPLPSWSSAGRGTRTASASSRCARCAAR